MVLVPYNSFFFHICVFTESKAIIFTRVCNLSNNIAKKKPGKIQTLAGLKLTDTGGAGISRMIVPIGHAYCRRHTLESHQNLNFSGFLSAFKL